MHKLTSKQIKLMNEQTNYEQTKNKLIKEWMNK